MKIVIKGFVKSSLIDWDGRIVSTLYVPCCNMRCPFCHNGGLLLNPEGYQTIPINEIKDFYKQRQDFMDGICLTGGEPCLYEDVLDFMEEFKEIGAMVKLDTNGTNPGIIEEAISKRIVDYIAMDIKAPLEFDAYNKASKVQSEKLFKNVKESIKIIMSSDIDYEFRTTVVPGLHDKEDIRKIVEFIRGAKRYALQNFQPDGVLDKKLQEIKPYKKEILEKIADGIRGSVESVIVRGRE
ncbi:MAG: anaerobic ribonucleoside-triphosphate reductase activating protein [Candidatus Omnitrophica bacterium]|nr:anaerobic ribonucleoside-triphosphate reductase activating protein [Candidatus Omnitrophota bacterium]